YQISNFKFLPLRPSAARATVGSQPSPYSPASPDSSRPLRMQRGQFGFIVNRLICNDIQRSFFISPCKTLQNVAFFRPPIARFSQNSTIGLSGVTNQPDVKPIFTDF